MGKRHSQQLFIDNESVECALYSNQGRRRSMEDRHVICLSLPQHKSYSLYGVFDGFNGSDASTYLADNISKIMDRLSDLEDNDAIINAINQADSKWIHVDDVNAYNNNAGTTFVLVLINKCTVRENTDETSTSYMDTQESLRDTLRSVASYTDTPISTNDADFLEPPASSFREKGYKVRVFWAGDSRAMLMSKKGTFENLTVDHHCGVEQEAKRIVNAKGAVINNRIDGVCEVTRGFGCYAMKNNKDLPKEEQKMSAIAEYNQIYCTKDDRLLIFCDGLTKKWSQNRLNRNCQHHILQHEEEKKGLLYALEYLSEEAMDDGSRDNITVMSVKFK